MSKLYCVGLTGSIGSGKSTVLAMFRDLGAGIISADHVARELTEPNQPALLAIEKHFGSEILDKEGRLKRSYLRDIIFKNPRKRLWLEALLHPLIRQRIFEKIQEIRQSYVVVEIPLLTKREDYPFLDRVVLVKTSRTEQIKRIQTRDSCSESQATAILVTQLPDTVREQIADDFIYNDGLLSGLKEQVRCLHERYRTEV